MAILDLSDELYNHLIQLAATRNLTIEDLLQQFITRDATFENSMDGMLIVDDDMNYVDANPAATDILGYSYDEILQLNIADITVPAKEQIQQDWEHLQHNRNMRDEYTIRHKTGHQITIEFIAVSNVVEGRHVSIFKDVTQRHAMEEQLIISERRFKAFIDNTPMVAYIKDADSNYIFSNRHLQQEIAESGIQYTNKTPIDLFQPEVLARLQEADQQVLEQGETVAIEDYVIHFPHGDRWYQEIKFPVFGVQQQPLIGGFAIDITRLKKAEQEVRQRQEFITQIANTVPGIIYVHDIRTHKNVYTNKKTTDLLGYTPQDLKDISGNLLDELTHPDDLPDLMNHFKKLSQLEDDEQVLEINYRMRHRDGHYLWFNSRDKVAQQDSNGNVIHIMGIAIDVTEQEHMRAERQQMLDRSPIPIGIATLDGIIEYYNDIFTTSFGYTLEDTPTIADWRIKAYPDPDYRAETRQQWQRDLHHAQETNNLIPARIYLITDKWGLVHTVSIQASILGNRILSTFLDVTDQQRMQQALIQSEQRYRALFDNALYSIVIYNLDGSIQMINQTAATSLGYEPEDMVGHLLEEFYPGSHENTIAFIQQVLDTEDTTTIEQEININGETRIIWSAAHTIHDTDGQVTGIQVISHNVTAQRQAERLHQQQEQLELSLTKERQISTLRTRLLTTISHEFRTPLTIIQTNAEMLMRYRDRLTVERQDQKINQIITQIRHLTGMLDNVRTVSKSQHGDIDYQPTTVNLTDFCASLESHFNEVKRSDQTLDLTIDTQQDNGYFDGALMYQALVNLLNNAIKYSPDSAAISLTLQQDDNILNFILGDKGIGISRNDITNIYQPFFRGKNAENERGTGLGLAIVRDIVDLHHGHISCESEVNKGTTFTIRLSDTLVRSSQSQSDEPKTPSPPST